MMPALPIEGYDTTREDGVTRIRPVYAAPLPVETVSAQGQGLIPQETPALPVELPVERSGGILANVDSALSGAVRAPFDALDERLFGKSGKKGTYREAIQKFFKTGPSDEVKTGVNRLLGTGGEERYKTWPEKLVVDAVTAPGNVLKSETPVSTEELIKPALDVSNLAGTGGLAGAGSGAGIALGSGPIRQMTNALSKSEKPFYSALERSLGSINQNKASGEQWLGMLANKGGVKPDELQWSGVSEFLAGKPSVTKAELEGFLKENAFVLGEKTSHTPNPRLKEIMDLDTQVRKLEAAGDKEGAAKIREVIKAIPPTGDFNPRYKQYQLPGGKNYREVLMTLPEKKFSRTDPRVMEEAKLAYKEKDIPRLSDDQWRMLQARAARRNGDKLDEVYRSSHWDEPNILAHMRMNDRTIDGKKSLHLEEIQSDWHQAGRKQGYRSANDPTPKIQEIDKKLSEIRNKEGVIDPFKLYGVNKEYTKLADERAELYKSINNGVPDAPFKKNWHELALKRAIREAAENGYDRLSWTPGEAQAARYDLSKQVDKIAIPMVNKDGTRSVRIDAKDGIPFKLMVDKTGIVDGSHSSAQFSGKPLSDVVGKEMADKIMKLEKADEFSGLDLKVGGEGMKGFYDNIVPKTIEKLGKQFGVKVQTGKSGKDTIYYIDIPPAMRDKVLAEGFPLFSANVPVIDNDQAR